MDVDWFKRFNDHYGHPAGDQCLKAVATALAEVVGRSGDLVARYGGEEFAVIALNADASAAKLLAENMCEKVTVQAGEFKRF